MSSIKKNFLYNATYQIINIILPLVSTPYLSRVLGPELVGIYSYTYSITYYFVLFATCGMSTYGVRAIARAMDSREERSRVFWSAYYSQLLIGAGILAAYICYVAFIHEGGIVICFYWGMYVLSALADISWLLFGCNEFKVPTIRSAIIRLAQFGMVLIFVRSGEDLPKYVLIYAAGFLLNQLLLWPFIHRHVDFYQPRWGEVKLHIVPNIRLFLPVIAVSLYTTLDKIMLGSMSNMIETGYFDYAEKISRLPLTAITALGTVMLPKMSALIASERRREAYALIEKSVWVMLLVAFAFAFGIMAIGDVFVPVYLGDQFCAAIPLVTLMSVIIPIISITNVIGKQFMLPSLMDSQYTASLLFGAAINVVVNLALIPRFAALGAAIGTVAAETTVLVVQAVLVRKEIRLTRMVRIATPFFFIGLAMYFVVRICSNYIIATYGTSLISLAIEVLIGAIFYSTIAIIYCFTTKNRIAMELLPNAISSLRKKEVVSK